MAAKDKSVLMKAMRKERSAAGLVRKEVWIHKSRTRAELDAAVNKLKKPANSA